MPETEKLQPIVNFLFEVGILSKTPRSGYYFLGSGHQSVAEHNNRVVCIGLVLATMTPGVDVSKVMKMCLLHDLTEGRISDLNYVHQKYTERLEDKAWHDLTEKLPFGQDFLDLIKEYNARETIESKIAKDADQMEWIFSLKEQLDTGNSKAKDWIPSAVKRLKTEMAQEVAKLAVSTHSDDWWFADKEDEWWVSRNKK